MEKLSQSIRRKGLNWTQAAATVEEIGIHQFATKAELAELRAFFTANGNTVSAN